MFAEGDYIVYGSNGVCKVEKIGPCDLSGTDQDRMYYTLLPVFSNGSRIFTPVDNQKVAMRYVMTKAEAEKLLSDLPEMESLRVEDEKKREEIYSALVQSGACADWIKLIKALNLRRKERLEEGKRLAGVDERYLKLAEDCLYGELSLVLETEKEEAEQMVLSNLYADAVR